MSDHQILANDDRMCALSESANCGPAGAGVHIQTDDDQPAWDRVGRHKECILALGRLSVTLPPCSTWLRCCGREGALFGW